MKYLARQPILNRARELFAYELLFRNGIQNSCDGLDLEWLRQPSWTPLF